MSATNTQPDGPEQEDGATPRGVAAPSRAPLVSSCFRRRDDRVPLLRPAPDRRAGGHLAAHRARRRSAVADRSPLVLTIGRSRGYVVLFNGVFVRPDRRSTCVRATRSPWRAWRRRACSAPAASAASRSRRGRCGGPGCRGARSPTRRSRSSILQYAIYMCRSWSSGSGCDRACCPGPAPFAVTVVPAILGAIAILVALALALVPTDLQRRLDRFGRARRAARARSRGASRTCRRRSRRACARRVDHVRRNDPAIAGVARFWGGQHRDAVGVVPRVRPRAVDRGASRWASASACSATCCRSRAASAASTAA